MDVDGTREARFTVVMTMGSRMDAAMKSISHIRAKPAELVAVMVRAPAAAEPMQALMAECSDSTVTNSALTTPSATYWLNVCTTSVCGVIG